MPTDHSTEPQLAPVLEAIAQAAHDRLHAEAGENPATASEAQRRVAETASAAIAAGAELSAIANAEQTGHERARRALSGDVLKRIDRAAKRKHEADAEYEGAVQRAGRLGLSHREIATAAHVTHGTVRAILTRRNAGVDSHQPSRDNKAVADIGGEQPAA